MVEYIVIGLSIIVSLCAIYTYYKPSIEIARCDNRVGLLLWYNNWEHPEYYRRDFKVLILKL